MSVPYFYSQKSTLAGETKAKNDRFRIGVIGAGDMALGNMWSASDLCNVVAIADVDSGRLERANHMMSQGKADTYVDYRHILERSDINAVHIATPDHWHAKPLIEAMLAGKDVYCEKPLTLTIDEGKLVQKIQQQTARVVQVGTQQRSTFQLFTKAIAIIEAGRLGKIQRITACIGGGVVSKPLPKVAVPTTLDWDRWIGPAPMMDYRELHDDARRQKAAKKPPSPIYPAGYFPYSNGYHEFRWWYQFSGGKLTDWGAHHVDIAIWALSANKQPDEPIKIGGTATHPVPFKDGMPEVEDRYNTASSFHLVASFSDNTQLNIVSEHPDFDNGILIEGEKGRLFVNRGKLTGSVVDALKDDPLAEDAIQRAYRNLPIEYNERKAHWANFFHCVRERTEPISDVGSHMKMLNVCHLAGISARLGREIQWDAATKQIIGDKHANAMLSRPYRKGYEIEI